MHDYHKPINPPTRFFVDNYIQDKKDNIRKRNVIRKKIRLRLQHYHIARTPNVSSEGMTPKRDLRLSKNRK